MSITIYGIKHPLVQMGDGSASSARPVKRLSVQQREHHTIDSTTLAQSLIRWVNRFPAFSRLTSIRGKAIFPMLALYGINILIALFFGKKKKEKKSQEDTPAG